jgi:hypothetical protein
MTNDMAPISRFSVMWNDSIEHLGLRSLMSNERPVA